MEFIVGKYYETRDGRKAQFLEYREGLNGNNFAIFKVEGQDSELVLLSDGRLAFSSFESEDDIVAEWSEPQPLKLEVGKWYKAENGEVGECIGVDKMQEVFSVKFQQSKICYFNEDGSRWYKVKEHKPELRIVSEVPNPNPGEVCEREPQQSEAQNLVSAIKAAKLEVQSKQDFETELNETIRKARIGRAVDLVHCVSQWAKSGNLPKVEHVEELLELVKELQPTKEAEPEKDGRNFEELEVGGVYGDRLGRSVTITNFYNDGSKQPYTGSNGMYYCIDGSCYIDNVSHHDLIRKIN